MKYEYCKQAWGAYEEILFISTFNNLASSGILPPTVRNETIIPTACKLPCK